MNEEPLCGGPTKPEPASPCVQVVEAELAAGSFSYERGTPVQAVSYERGAPVQVVEAELAAGAPVPRATLASEDPGAPPSKD